MKISLESTLFPDPTWKEMRENESPAEVSHAIYTSLDPSSVDTSLNFQNEGIPSCEEGINVEMNPFKDSSGYANVTDEGIVSSNIFSSLISGIQRL